MGARTLRTYLLAAAAICVFIVALLGALVWSRWGTLQDLDTDLGTPLQAWSFRHPTAVRVLLYVELAFGTIGTIAYGLVLVVWLWRTDRRRAAVWTIVVMLGASLTTTALKLMLRRQRPQWGDPVHALNSFSFPSSHASFIASGMGVAVVLAVLYVYGSVARQIIYWAAGMLTVLVGVDRILLGVHNLSDVLAGYAVAGIWLFTTLVICPPEPGLTS